MLDGVINLLGVVVTIVNIINVKQNNVEKDAATQRISRTEEIGLKVLAVGEFYV